MSDRPRKKGSECVGTLTVLVLISEMDLLTKKKNKEMDEATCVTALVRQPLEARTTVFSVATLNPRIKLS